MSGTPGHITQHEAQFVSTVAPRDTSGFVYPMAPVVVVPDESNGFSGTKVKMEHPDFAYEDGIDYAAPYGTEPPAGQEREPESCVFETVRVVSPIHNLIVGPNNLAQRREQLSNMGPVLMSRLEARIEQAYLSKLAGFSATSLTGGSGKLADMAEADNIIGLMFEGLGDAGFYNYGEARRVAVIDELDLMVLGRYEEVTGQLESGYGAERRNGGIRPDGVIAFLKEKLLLDDVRVVRGAFNTATARGTVTRGRAGIGGSMCVFLESQSRTYNAMANDAPHFGVVAVTSQQGGPKPSLVVDDVNKRTKTQALYAEAFVKFIDVTATASYSSQVPQGIRFSDIR